MTIGEKIKSLRKNISLSQEDFAERLHVSRSAVAKWESNNGVPDIGNLKMSDDYLHVRIKSFDSLEDQLELGETIPISDICKIEELSD